jgi:hypothetical protein
MACIASLKTNSMENWQNGDTGIATKEWIESIGALVEELTEAALDAFPESLEFEDVIGDDPADGYNELDRKRRVRSNQRRPGHAEEKRMMCGRVCQEA